MSKSKRIHSTFQVAATLLLLVALAACGSHRKAEGGRPVQTTVGKTGDKKESTKQTTSQTKPQKRAASMKWGEVEYKGEPWVKNVSKPFEITRGLQNRHIALWQSHGRYYDGEKARWKWQRPLLFGTTEDLYTQTIVVPYLIPMLENAGANVFTPRERDWQAQEEIVDNDAAVSQTYYVELNGHNAWQKAPKAGFARHGGAYRDGENPFTAGTARMARAIKNGMQSTVVYRPNIPKDGQYAVYVSYQTTDESVPDAHYTVSHQGMRTEFRVNQQMGGGTWVYLGTFQFDAGCSMDNSVTVTNLSNHHGVVTTDAVRFGGGMGNITRGGSVSGLPRFLEGARYSAQWAGAPYSIYGGYKGEDDYKDDINTRSLMTNWLGGGSPYMPTKEGLGVPIELSLAVHSDAGYEKDFRSLTGSLAICTTDYNEGQLGSGLSRQTSKELAQQLLDGVSKDITSQYGRWNIRYLWDRNYSETRMPEVPSAILETLSHQNFPDMVMGQDPNFKFTLARSIYKTLLRFITSKHGDNYVVAPLPPQLMSVEITDNQEAEVKWRETTDNTEPTAKPTSYILYKALGTGGFDKGTVVEGNSARIPMLPGITYSFKVTAVNRGGESFPSEVLSALCQAGAKRTVLVVNGFHRLAAPAVVDNDSLQGFDFNRDPGISYMRTAGWSGRQIDFNKSGAGREGEGALGYSGTEWQGKVIAGNTQDYVRTHTEAIGKAGLYNVCSCSSQSLEQGYTDALRYHCVDLVLGLEKYNRHQLVFYKTFSSKMQEKLAAYAQTGGALLVSGSYIGTDMMAETERQFLNNVLHLELGGTQMRNTDAQISGMGTTMDIYRTLNEQHYAATAPDILLPTGQAFAALTYQDQTPAAVAYQGQLYRSFTMGFPFECITSTAKRASIMKGILSFLIP